LNYNLERTILGRQFVLSESKASPEDLREQEWKENGESKGDGKAGGRKRLGDAEAASSQLITSSQ